MPWYIWCSVAAVTSAVIGVHWDISWHRSIGRDTFWTPAHIAIYLCGVLSGIANGFLIFSTTFGRQRGDASVRLWGFRGPLGAFICAWGGIAMLTSAPFDNWWHSAYGLDVKILSPPHTILAAGLLAVAFGTLVLALGSMNRAEGVRREKLRWLFLYVGAAIVVFLLTVTMEYVFRIYMHSALFYRTVAMRASGRRWASATVIAMYTVFLAGLVWVLPLFAAEPKLGPVYQKVTHFIPPEFPLLLIVPAVVLNVVWSRTAGWNLWLQAVVASPAFLVSFLGVQWPFADFLMSPAARNRFFGTIYFDYNLSPTTYYFRYLFMPLERTRGEFWEGLASRSWRQS